MLKISARDANHQFSKILEAATRGEEVVITRRGVPVARLSGITDPVAEAEQEERRRQALAFFLRGGAPGGVVADWTREEIYADRCERAGGNADTG